MLKVPHSVLEDIKKHLQSVEKNFDTAKYIKGSIEDTKLRSKNLKLIKFLEEEYYV